MHEAQSKSSKSGKAGGAASPSCASCTGLTGQVQAQVMPAYAHGQDSAPAVQLLGASVQRNADRGYRPEERERDIEDESRQPAPIQQKAAEEEETAEPPEEVMEDEDAVQPKEAGGGGESAGDGDAPIGNGGAAAGGGDSAAPAGGATGGGAEPVQSVASQGLSGAHRALPNLERIQDAFGSHDVSGVRVQVGGPAERANRRLGSLAYASGNRIAFGREPDLRLAAHEAAHVVQQRRGVHLKGGVGEEGDPYERQADRAADAVAAGGSAEEVLDEDPAGAEAGGVGVQRKCECGGTCASCSKQEAQRDQSSVQMREEEDEGESLVEDDDAPVQMQLEVTTERPRAEDFAGGGGGGGGGGAAAGKKEAPPKEKEEGGEEKKAAEGEAEAAAEEAKGEAQASVADQSAAVAETPAVEKNAAAEVTGPKPAEGGAEGTGKDETEKREEEEKGEALEKEERERKRKERAQKEAGEPRPQESPVPVQTKAEPPVQSKADAAVQMKCDPAQPTPKPADFEEKKEPPPEPPPGKTEDNGKSESPSTADQPQGCGAEQMASQLETAAPGEEAAAPAEEAATAEPAATEAAPEGGGAATPGAKKGAGGSPGEGGGGGAPGGGGGAAAETGMESNVGQAEAGRAEAVAAYEASDASLGQATADASQLASFNVTFPRVEGGGEGEEKRRSAASDALRGFLSDGAGRVSDALSFAQDTVPERAASAAAAAKAQVESAAEASAASLSGRVAQARSDAHAQAAALAAQVNAAHDASVATIEEETNSALDTLDAEYNSAAQQIPTIESDQITALTELYAEGDRQYREIGRDVGAAAAKRGEFYAQHYDGCHINRKDSFWDGYLTDRRADARMKAARDVAKSYKESLEKEANKQADEGAKGLKCDQEAVHKSAATTLETLDKQYQSAVEMLLKAQTRAVASAGTARDQSLAAAEQALAATLAGLDDTERSQLRTISDTAYMQVVAVEHAAHMAASSLQGNILQAAGSLNDALRSVATSLTAGPAPEPESLARALGGGRAKMEARLASLYEKINGGLSGVEGQIADHGNQSSEAVSNAGADGVAQVDQAMAGFAQTMSALEQSASDSLSKLTEGHVTSVTEMTASATDGFRQQVDGLEQSYADLNASVKGRFDEATKGLEAGLRDSLKGIDSGKDSIPHYADEAASKEAPAWKSVVKWVLIIAIIVVVALVVGPAVIGAVGAWAGSAFAGAVIGGAIVGAATGAAIQMLNNWETNTTWHEGVGTAALMGAVGGALGGAGGFLIGRAMDAVGKLAISAISKKAIEIGANLAFDAVQEIATQIVTTGKVDWSEFGKSMVMSLAMAGAGEIPAVKKVQANFQAKGEAIGGKIPGARTPKPEVSAGGAKPSADAAPETAAPKAPAEPEAAAPKGAAEPEAAAPKTGPEPEAAAPKTAAEGEAPHAPPKESPRTDAEVKAETDAKVAEGTPAKAEAGETPRLDSDPEAPAKSHTDADMAEATAPTKVGDEDHGVTPRKMGDKVELWGCSNACGQIKGKIKDMMAEIEKIPPAQRTPAQAELHAKLQELHTKVEGAETRLSANEKTKSIIDETGAIAKEFKALGEQHETVGKGLNDPTAVKAETGEGTVVKPGETPAAPKPGEPGATTVKPGEEGTPAAKPAEKPLDVEKDLGVKSEPVQHLGHDDFDKVQLNPKQDALYILRDADGNILKVGKTSARGAKDRFKKYKDSGDMLGIKVTLEVHPLNMRSLRGKKVKAEHFESKLREKMESGGEIMPWDNTKGRLGFKGPGTPAERGKSPGKPRIDKNELDQLLKKHNGDPQKAADEWKKNMPNKQLHRRTILRWAQEHGLDVQTYKPTAPKGP